MHFFFLEPGIDARFYVEFDLTRPLSLSTSANIDFDWDTYESGSLNENHTVSIYAALPAEYFSSHFVGRIQFPCADDFIIRVDSDPDASLLLKIDGIVVFTTSPSSMETNPTNRGAHRQSGQSVLLCAVSKDTYY